MNIGKLTVKDYEEKTVFETEITNLSIQSGLVFMEMAGTFIPSFPLSRGQVYKITISEISNQNDINLSAQFEDYSFSATGTDYIDENGIYHAGTAVLNNRLQFRIVG